MCGVKKSRTHHKDVWARVHPSGFCVDQNLCTTLSTADYKQASVRDAIGCCGRLLCSYCLRTFEICTARTFDCLFPWHLCIVPPARTGLDAGRGSVKARKRSQDEPWASPRRVSQDACACVSLCAQIEREEEKGHVHDPQTKFRKGEGLFRP